MFGMGMQELIIIGGIAVLLFGKRLPEVARSLGGSYRQFRQGLSDFQSSVDFSGDSYSPPRNIPQRRYDEVDDYEEATAPKFEPPPSEPRPE
ncbi:Sec-independent protein translocase subunit TatA/TatB [Lignipirellula cremea]|uniref:Sec-independent protein translocase protein TatA n=1 Tax=Lignipirellula cremea TaxID=2528010 RepID=A0A518E3K4_9BACT|nr:twin-arginine translocase TatA/TatE family subunit [Lignipirellula cremea]QDU98675.1 sec-independent translocase [Lignipirellula cremea]